MNYRFILTLIIAGISSTAWGQAVQKEDSVKTTQLQELVVDGQRVQNLNSATMGKMTFSGEELLSMPALFSEPDIVRALQTQPGVSQGVEGFTGLYVRGGENDQNLFLYQGLPLYHVSHLGGIFSSFNVATVSKADFYKSSFPAQFGGRVSSITDITMSKGSTDRLRGRLSLGLLSGNVYLTGPIVNENTTFAVGLRRSWIDIVSIPTLAVMNAIKKKKGEKYIASYNFTDFNARIEHRFNPHLSAYVMGYYGHDYFKIGQRDFESTQNNSFVVGPDGSISEAPVEVSPFYDENTNRLSWGNWGILGNLTYKPRKGTLMMNIYYSRYSSDYRQEHEWQRDMTDELSHGYTRSRTQNWVGDFGINLDYDAQLFDIWRFEAGGGYIYHNFMPEKLRNEFLSKGETSEDYNDSRNVYSNEGFLYIDNTLSPWQFLSVNAGVRGVVYESQNDTRAWLEPRVSARVKFHEDYSFKVGYAHMVQSAQQVSNNYINLPTDLWQPVCAPFKPLVSKQISAGVYGNLPWYEMWFSLEGWYKDLKNILEYREGISVLNPDLTWIEKLTSGKGWSYGADLQINGKIWKIDWSLGYGLMWNWRKFDDLNQGLKFPAKFDNRHKINIQANWHITPKIELNANWVYSTGNRLTLSLYNYELAHVFYPDAPQILTEHLDKDGLGWYSHRNNIRMPAYHRLDLSLTIHQTLKKGRRGEWTIGLYNAYCHMNAITIKKDASIIWDTNIDTRYYRSFKTLSFIPVIPSVSYTYIF